MSMSIAWAGFPCNYVCSMGSPYTNQNLTPGASFEMSGSYTYNIKGTGCAVSANLYAQFYNGTWYNLTTTGNLSTADTNPQVGYGNSFEGRPYWTVTANDPSPSLYYVRISCGNSGAYGYSANNSVNVTIPPPYQCKTISVNTNLTDTPSTGVCYNFTASNIYLDCRGRTIYGNNTGHPAFFINGYNNITIRNCIGTKFSDVFYVNNSQNDSFYNHTFTGWRNGTGAFSGDVLTKNIAISNLSFWNFSAGFNLNQSANITVFNVTINQTYACINETGISGTTLDNYFNQLTCNNSNYSYYSISGFGTKIGNSTLSQNDAYNKATINCTNCGNIYFQNTTGNFTNRTLSTYGNFTVQYYMRVNTTNGAGWGMPVTLTVQKNVTGSNTTYSGFVNGLSDWFLADYNFFSGSTIKNYTQWASAYWSETVLPDPVGMTNATTAVAESSGTTALLLLYSTCGIITSSATLTTDLSSLGNCVTFGANDVTLDCAGHSIGWGTDGHDCAYQMKGIQNTGYNRTTIKNCIITTIYRTFGTECLEGGDGNAMEFGGYDIYYSSARNTTFTNNTLFNTGESSGAGIYLGSVINATITNHTITLGVTGGDPDARTVAQTNGIQGSGVYNSTFNNVSISIWSANNYNGWAGNNIGVYLTTAKNVSMNALTINANDFASDSCIVLSATNNSLIENSTLTCASSSVSADATTYTNYLRGLSFDRSKVSVTAGGNLTIQWYVRVNVTSAGVAVSATVNDTQNTASKNATFFGYYSLTPWYVVNDTAVVGSSLVSYNNHTIKVNNSLYTNVTQSINITGSWTINISLTLIGGDNPPVIVGILYTNYTKAGFLVLFNGSVTDDIALTYCTYAFNITGSFVNESPITISGVSSYCYQNKSFAYPGNYSVKLYVNDSTNQVTSGTYVVYISPTGPELGQYMLPIGVTLAGGALAYYAYNRRRR